MAQQLEKRAAELPSALERMEQILERLAGSTPAIFLDYDGVLTPIVRRPDEAVISHAMRRTVQDLAEVCHVAVVSGRDLKDVQKMAGIRNIVYAGSHGFDIEGPAGKEMAFREGENYLVALDRAEGMLRDSLEVIQGARIERKRFAIAVHYREVDDMDVHAVEESVDAVLQMMMGLRKTGGKKIFELRPDFDWDKGKAVDFLLEKLDLRRPDILPFYLGDDLTDEDAFRELQGRGVSILVRDEDRPTRAEYALESPDEVQEFLGILAERLRKS